MTGLGGVHCTSTSEARRATPSVRESRTCPAGRACTACTSPGRPSVRASVHEWVPTSPLTVSSCAKTLLAASLGIDEFDPHPASAQMAVSAASTCNLDLRLHSAFVRADSSRRSCGVRACAGICDLRFASFVFPASGLRPLGRAMSRAGAVFGQMLRSAFLVTGVS